MVNCEYVSKFCDLSKLINVEECPKRLYNLCCLINNTRAVEIEFTID